MYSRGLCSPKEMLIVRSQNPLQVDRPLDHPNATWPIIQGTAGCKNTRLGGDTIHDVGETWEDQIYMTYVVYRSFRHPPPVKKCVWYVSTNGSALLKRPTSGPQQEGKKWLATICQVSGLSLVCNKFLLERNFSLNCLMNSRPRRCAKLCKTLPQCDTFVTSTLWFAFFFLPLTLLPGVPRPHVLRSSGQPKQL